MVTDRKVRQVQVVIAGCGRAGAQLAQALDGQGHAVTVIDRSADAFRRLDDAFGGRTIVGVVFDRDTLRSAGIGEADAFVAVTSGDNSNIVSARVARERFGVPQVLARIYDPERAVIYERHGITTIATARWTSDAILAQLTGDAQTIAAGIGPGDGDVVVLARDLGDAVEPTSTDALRADGRWLPVAVTRSGQTTVAQAREVVQGGDRVYLAVQRADLDHARAFLDGLEDGS